MATKIPVIGAENDFRKVLLYTMKLSELLLDDPELAALRARVPDHPAVVRYDEIKRFIERRYNLSYPDETDSLAAIGSTLLDGSAFIAGATPEEVIHRITDPNVLSELRSRVGNARMYLDQLSALTIWFLLDNNGIPARLVEQSGHPDILIWPETSQQTWMECKRIRLGTSTSRLRQDIKDANKQIKRVNQDGSGIVYVCVERPKYEMALDSDYHPFVEECISEVDRELCSGYSRSISAAVVCWEDHLILGHYPNPTLHVIRRHSVLRRHANPRRAWEGPDELFTRGQCVEFPIKWRVSATQYDAADLRRPVRAISQDNIVVSELFRSNTERHGIVRAAHAIAIMREPGKLFEHSLDGGKVLLVTRWINVTTNPFLVLLVANSKKGQNISVTDGFRLYPDGQEIHPQTDPLLAFGHLIERFGLNVVSGQLRGKFILHAEVRENGDGQTKFVEYQGRDNVRYTVSAMVKRLATSPRVWRVDWCFGIDLDLYLAHIHRYKH